MTRTSLFRRRNTCILFFSLSVLSSGCGSSKSTKFSTASRGIPSSTVSSGYKIGECNRLNFSQFNLHGQIGTYYSPLTRQLSPDMLNLNLVSIPDEIFNSSTYQIRIYRWSERIPGQKVVNQIPVKFFFVDKLTGHQAPTTAADQISSATINQARQILGTTWLNVGATQFFDRVMLLLTGVDMQYDALAFALYNTATSSYAIAQENVLLPPFYSNPNVYKSLNPAPDLYTLHPNYTLINSNATENDYLQIIQDICRELSGVDSRIPASEPKTPEPQSILQRIWSRILESFEAFTDLLSTRWL